MTAEIVAPDQIPIARNEPAPRLPKGTDWRRALQHALILSKCNQCTSRLGRQHDCHFVLCNLVITVTAGQEIIVTAGVCMATEPPFQILTTN